VWSNFPLANSFFPAMNPPFTILVTGPESSGKTTLARQLALALDGLYVAEAARDYLNAQNGEYTEADLPLIWSAQKEAEDAARATSASFVVCDTGPEVIRVWAEVKYGRCPEDARRGSQERRYDIVLLCAPDLPWEADPLREAKDISVRQQLFSRYKSILPDYKVISGKNRLEQALKLVLVVSRR
jgi:NadR type nicotinamide-nucleotide adenylyltransferase